MGQYDSVFSSILNAKPISNFASRLPAGKHKVTLKRFAPKRSERGLGTILEADFVVVDSTTLKPGDSRGWAWFIDSQGHAGEYERGRAQDYIAKMGQCIGDARPVDQVGASLTDGSYCGVVIEVDVQQQFERDGQTPKLSKKGAPMFNAIWKPLGGQTADTIAAVRAMVDAGDTASAPTQATVAPAPMQTAAAPAPAAAPPSILSSLRRS